MREVVIDTETTGLNKSNNGRGLSDGHRIIEIGCVEMMDKVITGQTYHSLINPGAVKIDPIATKIHGITEACVRSAPTFADIVTSLLDFIGDATLIIHNAPFDIEFLDKEFKLLEDSKKPTKNFTVIDTLKIARDRHPFMPNDLDSVSNRYRVRGHKREKHSALLDAKILARVYIAMDREWPVS